MNVLILGAGLSGLSASYHLGHNICLILEKSSVPCGHIGSTFKNGFTWDQGPHVSFTQDEYVRDLFSRSVDSQFEEYEVTIRNYFQGHWIDHPAQSNLYQVPEPLRSECIGALREARKNPCAAPKHYGEWLDYAFGSVFATTFPASYTRKYWTVEPKELGLDWVGNRIFFPNTEDFERGALGPLERQTHYITKVRYPSCGGYQSFAKILVKNARIKTSTAVVKINLQKQAVTSKDSSGNETEYHYDRLINTLPLPVFMELSGPHPADVENAALKLNCTKLLLVNIEVPHPTQIDGNWFYIYDESMMSTRINCTERLSPRNAPSGYSGIQVEVYAHPKKGFSKPIDQVARQVVWECASMGFINRALLNRNSKSVFEDLPGVRWHWKEIEYANVIFDHDRRSALNTIWSYLEKYGLEREIDDLEPTIKSNDRVAFGSIAMAGRYAQWKYLWTDDCVLRGRFLAKTI